MSKIAIAGTIIIFGLSGCGDNIELTERPDERANDRKAESVHTQVFIANRVDIPDLASQIDSKLPAKIASVSQRLRRAACIQKKRKICSNARVTGKVTKDGTIRVSSKNQEILIEVPLAYDLSARGQGAAREVRDNAEGKLTALVSYKVSLNEKLEADVQIGNSIRWKENVEAKILGKNIDFQKAVERRLIANLRGTAKTFEKALDISPLVEATAGAWRYLHYPIQLSSNPDIWFRGKPTGLNFAGFAEVDGNLEVRIAIITDLKTTVGERPVPLIPRNLPKISSDPVSEDKTRLIIPVKIDYDVIKKALNDALPVGEELKDHGTKDIAELTVTDLDLFPSGKNLALAIGLEVNPADRWTDISGTAYLTGKPHYFKKEATLGLSRIKLSEPSSDPELYRNDEFILPNKDLRKIFGDNVRIDIRKTFAAELARVNAAASRKLGEGLKIEGRFQDLEVSSVALGRDGLLVNLMLVGALTVLHDDQLKTEDNLLTTADQPRTN